MNGKLVPWDDARVHVSAHALHYGSSVFEGVRCYKTPKGSAVFRLDAHTERLFNSAKVYWMEMPLTQAAAERRRARRRSPRTSSTPATSVRSSSAARVRSASTRSAAPSTS